MAEGLALLGSQPDALIHCGINKRQDIAVLTIREMLNTADWRRWGSLNNLLPILAEAAPEEFLSAVDKAVQQSPCPFDSLFSQESSGVGGRIYTSGVLWALECLAWDKTYLVRACVTLGGLAAHDPGGNFSNRPANSLTTILLPWLPQTTAPIPKRKVAVETLIRNSPTVAWKLLLSLLPNQHRSSIGTYKPIWRKFIPEDWEKGVSEEEYQEQVSIYAELAFSMASNDIEKLSKLVAYLDNLPPSVFEKTLEHLSSKEITNKPENERLQLWTKLLYFISEQKRFPDSKWTFTF